MTDFTKPRAKSPVKSKTFWGLGMLVAALLASKTGIPVTPEDVDLVLETVLGAAGAIMGVWGRMTAKERIKTPGVPLPVFAILMPLVLLHLVFGLTGCSTLPERVSPTKEGLAKRAVDLGLGLVLRNNPQYQPLALDCLARIDVLLARGYTNPDLVAEFIAELTAKYDLTSEDGEKITRTITELRFFYWLIYGEQFPLNVELSPSAVAFLQEVKVHIANAAALPVFFPKAPVAEAARRGGKGEGAGGKGLELPGPEDSAQ